MTDKPMTENERGQAEGRIRLYERSIGRKATRIEICAELLESLPKWKPRRIAVAVLELFPEREGR